MSSTVKKRKIAPISFSEKVAKKASLDNDGWNRIFHNPKLLLIALIAFRAVNACCIQTSYVPDEYWQSLEVAHYHTFGYPRTFLNIDQGFIMIYSPRLLQSIFAAVGDLHIYKLAEIFFDNSAARWTLCCSLISWFNFYCITRTLTNSLETIITIIGFCYWPWPWKNDKESPSCKIALSFAAIAFIVRPTSAIIWLPLCIWHMIWHAKNISKFLIVDVIPIASIFLCLSLIIDYIFYKQLVFVQYNFLYYNVFQNIGKFYGSNPWHWYFSQGFFVVVGTLTIPFIGGVLKSGVRQRFLIWIILWDILIHSCLSHKEFRFILSILPFVLCFCGSYLSIMWKVKDATVTRNRHSFWWFFTFLLTTNIAAAAYTSRIHQKGTIDAIHHIRSIGERHNTDRFSVMFLMPCHSTPFYCYIHKKIELSFLTCLPSNRPGYIDEADRFFLEPTSWLNRKFNSPDTNNVVPPNCLVFFDNLVTVIQTFLDKYHYKKNKSFFHTHFPEGRVGSNVIIHCLE
ncbi:GPI mannosyltransferase 3 [Trichoplax sp. H2]|nr:GPI mannosyltransferase 3 [Trichoplax sp. H2]|eukprot:RDD45763.1 GPI mannosyltransferase 3 [Trichoplax sp. H2]